MDERLISIGIMCVMVGSAFFGAALYYSPEASSASYSQMTEAMSNEEARSNPDAQTRGVEQERYASHLATRQEIEAMKAKIGVRERDKNYNIIIDGHGTGLAPPTEREWEAMISTLEIVDSVQGIRRLGGPLGASPDLMADPSFPAVGNQGA